MGVAEPGDVKRRDGGRSIRQVAVNYAAAGELHVFFIGEVQTSMRKRYRYLPHNVACNRGRQLKRDGEFVRRKISGVRLVA